MDLIAKYKDESINDVFNNVFKSYKKFNEEMILYVEPYLSKEDKLIIYYNEDEDIEYKLKLSNDLIKYCLKKGWKIIGNIGYGGSSSVFLVSNINRTILDKDYYAALVLKTNDCNINNNYDHIIDICSIQREGLFGKDTCEIYDLFTTYKKYSDDIRYCNTTFPHRIIQVLELVTTLDKAGDIIKNSIDIISNNLRKILEKIYKMDMIYTDIKPDNIGLTLEGKIKLIDLETIRKLRDDDSTDIDGVIKYFKIDLSE